MSSIGSKPTGFKGILTGHFMNLVHTGQYSRIIKRFIVSRLAAPGHPVILDIGCGGGKTIALISSFLPDARVCGIDHSDEMVRLARQINRKAMDAGKVEINRADVCILPYPDNSFNAVTAFDTINFWGDYNTAMDELLRVLKTGGLFFIINGYPSEGTKWYDFVRFKNENEYRTFLTDHGFREVETVIEKHTIIVSARK